METALKKFSSNYACNTVSKYYYDYEKAIKNHTKAVSFAKPVEALAKASAVKSNSEVQQQSDNVPDEALGPTESEIEPVFEDEDLEQEETFEMSM